MNFYPNYNQLNNYFVNNFNDYCDFVNKLEDLIFDSELKVYDTKQEKNTELNQTYKSKKFLSANNIIFDSYLNKFNTLTNTLEIVNYFEFPPYILYLIKDTNIDVTHAIKILNLTKYIIFNNHNEDIDDIEDIIYLKNKLAEYKFNVKEINDNLNKKNEKITELYSIINQLKLKNRKANFNLMENQNVFSELHAEIYEKDQLIKHKDQIIDEKYNQIQELNKKINEYESSFLFSIYEGFKVLFSRIHF
jgi:hypothetical protein